ncbi:MAG: beta-galactosidase [Pseudomonadota bacterium]
MAQTPVLGVCYYPEHWDASVWRRDAEKMVALGLTRVRIGEFAWAKIEPEPGVFDWAWLDDAIEALAGVGLEVMLGTPTATPPKWLVDAHPDILAKDRQGRVRAFGSRRHYCFSSRTYAREASRITTAMVQRYVGHPAVTHWQTDNELGCHDTVRSYSDEAARAFRLWLENRYGGVEALNKAWGTVFWSQTYQGFDAVDLPNLTVTEPNPAHVVDFYRFSSDVVVAFNAMQVEIIRAHAPDATVLHNAMGHFFQFDHAELGDDLDVVGWDSYPLGFLEAGPYTAAERSAFLRQGHPDFAGFHHDLYARCGHGRFQVIEQQPGPVNWARHNPAPLPDMVRLWTVEAAAHGAEAVQYFRWRQVPIAQEQMHSGLERIDGEPSEASAEVAAAAADLARLGPLPPREQAPVALMVSYRAHWLFEAQPHGRSWSYQRLLMDWYGALRRRGLDVDIVMPGDDLTGYKAVFAPSVPYVDEALAASFDATDGQVVIGPRSFSRTRNGAIPPDLPPGPLQGPLKLKVTRSESLPPAHVEPGEWADQPVGGVWWLDHVEARTRPLARTDAGQGLVYEAGRYTYVATVPDGPTLDRLVEHVCSAAGVALVDLPEGVRMRRRGAYVFVVNYASERRLIPAKLVPEGAEMIIGSAAQDPGGLTVWR